MPINIKKILGSADNLTPLLDEEELHKIGDLVVKDYEKDDLTRADWKTRSEDAMKLALQVRETKTYPWPKAANVKYPLLTISAIQFASRVQLFSGPDIVKCQINGFDPDGQKMDRGIRISKHMSYQIRQMPKWEDDNDRMMHALPILGCMFKKTYFDPITGKNVSELIYPRDLVFDYYAPDVDSCYRKTHVIPMIMNKIIERQREGIFRKVDLLDSPAPDERSLAKEIEGLDQPEDDMEDTPRVMLEQHRNYDMDGDGYQEPYIVTVDYRTHEVLRITPRFDKQGIKKRKGEIVSVESDEYFTQYTFIPDPNGGNLGIGFGHIQGPINEVANTLINQLIDAGTVSNLQSGFIGKGLRTKAGNYNFTPGEWKMVNATGEELKNNIVPLPVREPSQVLFTLLTLMLEGGEKIGSITDAIVGDNPPANQPATTTLATIEQGLKVFKKIHTRLYGCFSKEFAKHYKLNKRYLGPEDYFNVLDLPKSQMQVLMENTQQAIVQTGKMLVVPDDYKGDDTELTPSADPNVMTSTEKLQKMELLLQTMPTLGWNPEVVKKRFLEATEMPNPDELLTPPPPAPPDPKIELEKVKLQNEQQKMQMEQQNKGVEMQFKQQEMELNKQQIAAELEKTKMEIQKTQAEIQKIMVEVGDGQQQSIEQAKLKIDAHKIMADYDIKLKELQLKEVELGVKQQELQADSALRQQEMQVNSQMEQQRMTHEGTMKNRELQLKEDISGAPAMRKKLEDVDKERKTPKEVKRNKDGLIESVGKRKLKRDKDGHVTHISGEED